MAKHCVSSLTTKWLLEHGYSIGKDGGWHKTGGMARRADSQPNLGYEPVGTDAGKVHHARRRIVRITSYRRVLADERNLFDKHFVDALVRAKLLVDDSPQWCEVQVKQVQVGNAALERTEIVIV